MEVLIAVICVCIGAVTTIMFLKSRSMTFGAQSMTLGTITCRRIQVVDASGKVMGVMGTDEDGGRVDVFGKDGRVANMDGGRVSVFDKDGSPRAEMHGNESGNGAISSWDKNGDRQ